MRSIKNHQAHLWCILLSLPLLLGAAAGDGAEQPRREVKTFDDVQTALARATSARKQLVRAFICVLCVGLRLLVRWTDPYLSIGLPQHPLTNAKSPLSLPRTQNPQHEAGEKRALSLQEKRKQQTALQTNLARDRQEVAALEKEIVSVWWFGLFVLVCFVVSLFGWLVGWRDRFGWGWPRWRMRS